MSSDPTGWRPASIRCWATTIALNRSPDARMALWMDWSFGRWDRWSRLASNPERTALNIPAKGPEGMVGQNLRCWLLRSRTMRCAYRPSPACPHQTVRHTP